MAKLGFVGLGIMGGPMALNLMRGGHEVALWSHTKGKAEKLAAEGKHATVCASPADVAAKSECVFLCVGDTKMSREVILGADGLASGKKGALTIVDCSTISPTESKKIGAELKAKGIDFLEAPCSGSKSGAEGATLTFMIGGEPAVYERVKPYLEAMGKQLYYCGPAGMGLQAKLSQNMLLGSMLQAFIESFVLAAKAGVDPALLLDIVNNSAARSGMVSAKAPAAFARNFEPNFSVKWLEKDMALMLESAAEHNVPAPVTALSRQMLRAAIAEGYGDEDIVGAIRVLEKQAGVEVVTKK
ncbi:MAG TPA: NAD(P)-dependent oxidoreductase [Acidobacteriaceae bacterium]|nr:NAD(P)-dependent oxidoreductase [Acidobacteriaceae bacterium]